MKILYFLTGMIFCLFVHDIRSQTQLCYNSDRYKQQVFPLHTMTTTVFGVAPGPLLNLPQILTMDIYQPLGDNLSKRPLVILAFGGAFVYGDKKSPDIMELAIDLARKGYVIASIDYRLIPVTSIYTTDDIERLFYEGVAKAVYDQKAAIRWFRKNAAENGNTFRVDTNMILVGGVSAGAVLSIHTAYLDKVEEIPLKLQPFMNGDLEGNSGNPGYSSRVNGVINLCGGIGDTLWIEKDDVPVVSMHGDLDEVVPYASDTANPMDLQITLIHGSYSIQQRKEYLGDTAILYTFAGEGHTPFILNGPLMDTVKDFITPFMFDIICERFDEQQEPLGYENPGNGGMSFSLYPNPAREKVTVDVPGDPGKTADIFLWDMQGRVLQQFRNVPAAASMEIPVEGLAPGTYIVKILSGAFFGSALLVKE